MGMSLAIIIPAAGAATGDALMPEMTDRAVHRRVARAVADAWQKKTL